MRMTVSWALLLCIPTVALCANGDLDASFGTNGVARDNIALAITSSIGIFSTPPVVQADGKIIVCSIENTGGSSGKDFLISRFTANGVLDTSFSFDGKVNIDFDNGGGFDQCVGTAVQADGKIVVAGTTSITNSANGSDFAVARLNSDGTLDTTFGNGTGKTTVGFDLGGSNNDVAAAVALQGDGKIVVAGYAQTASSTGIVPNDFAVLRLNTDGSRDTSFNLTGKAHYGFNLATLPVVNDDQVRGMAIDAAGNIVLGGFATKGSQLVPTHQPDYDYAAMRLLPNGQLDANFNGDGRVLVPFDLGGVNGSSQDQAAALLLQHDGKIVLAGIVDTSSSSTTNLDMGFARLNPDGSLDPSFASAGKTTIAFDLTPNGVDLALGMVEQSNHKIIVAGATATSGGGAIAALVCLNRDGSPDSEFGILGKKTYNNNTLSPPQQIFYGLALQGNQIVASGLIGVTSTTFDVLAVRVTSDLIFANGFD